jgi:hypothetical protein
MNLRLIDFISSGLRTVSAVLLATHASGMCSVVQMKRKLRGTGSFIYAFGLSQDCFQTMSMNVARIHAEGGLAARGWIACFSRAATRLAEPR